MNGAGMGTGSEADSSASHLLSRKGASADLGVPAQFKADRLNLPGPVPSSQALFSSHLIEGCAQQITRSDPLFAALLGENNHLLGSLAGRGKTIRATLQYLMHYVNEMCEYISGSEQGEESRSIPRVRQTSGGFSNH